MSLHDFIQQNYKLCKVRVAVMVTLFFSKANPRKQCGKHDVIFMEIKAKMFLYFLWFCFGTIVRGQGVMMHAVFIPGQKVGEDVKCSREKNKTKPGII